MKKEEKTNAPYLAPECEQAGTMIPAGIICQSGVEYDVATDDYDWVEFEM